MEGCAAQCGRAQGQVWSQAVNKRAAGRVLYAELVNNEPTQERTGPQSNQCGFNVYRPLCARGCVSVCGCVQAELHHRINPEGKEVDRILTCPQFSSAFFPFRSLAIFSTFFPASSSSFQLLHTSLFPLIPLIFICSLRVTLVQE